MANGLAIAATDHPDQAVVRQPLAGEGIVGYNNR
jgi:hypothetical protein